MDFAYMEVRKTEDNLKPDEGPRKVSWNAIV